MIKVRNINVNDNIISMECLRNGSENDVCKVLMDRESLTLLPGNERDVYVYKAAAKVRQHYRKTGQIPREFTSVWY